MSERIIIFGPLPPPCGGVSVYVKALVDHFREDNIRVWTYSGGKPSDPKIRYIAHRRLETIPALLAEGRRAQIFDATHFHFEYPNLLLLPIWLVLKRILRFRWYKNVHDGSLPKRYPEFGPVTRWLFHRAVNAVDEFVVVSEQLRQWLREEVKAQQPILLIPALLPTTEDTDLSFETIEALRPYLSHEMRVCSIGVFFPSYGFHDVAQAVEELRERTGKDIGLLLVDGGFVLDGDYREQVLLDRDWITVLETIPNPEINGILKCSNVFVRACGDESYGISRIEALWAGVPVIATRAGETRGMLLYDFGNVAQLLDQLQAVLLHPIWENTNPWPERYRQEAEANLQALEMVLGQIGRLKPCSSSKRMILSCGSLNDRATSELKKANAFSLKQILRNRLSISSRLFLREVLATSVRTLHWVATAPRLLANRIGGRLGVHVGRSVRAAPPPPPALAAIARDSTAKLIAEKARSRDASPVLVQTSIIIPVFNKAEYTVQCLCSLLREIDLNGTEIIIVDNASSDDTASALAHFTNVVRVIRNTDNLGFGEACNKGAAKARGKYLVFLNNDTTVLPGWLTNLVETIEAAPDHGAVGSMFLYPDGSIQEAGAIVWRNGYAHHYGGAASPDDYRFNFAREVDYCSAASLLIRKDIFVRLSGFDRRYAPAYYEDVDLCFGVRSLGYRVIYQPASRLVHYEGITAGSDTSQSFKQFQVVNREKLVKKWRAVLEQDHLPQNLKQVAEASDRNRERPCVIVFDERIPSPDRDGGTLRMLRILKTLATWCHVIFVPFNRPQDVEYERALWKDGVETAESAVEYRRVLNRGNVIAAIVSRPSMASAFIHRIRRVNPRVGIIFDMVDTHFVRLQREYKISGDAAVLAEAERYRQLEQTLAEASDLVWSASMGDKDAMESVAHESRVEVVPTIHELRDRGKPFAGRHGLLFIGSLAHRPNEDAVLYFLREIFPLLQSRLPNITIDIIGDYASPAVKACDSQHVRILGYVPDVEPCLGDARVFVAPLRFGAGIKGKVGEAMAHGVPVVTTAIGAEGFGLTNGVDVMLADEPESFAAAIHALYTQEDLWNRLAENSYQRIEQHFIPQVIAETINRSIKEVSSRARR